MPRPLCSTLFPYTTLFRSDFGYFVTENQVGVHDLQATILHLMGLDAHKLSYAYQGDRKSTRLNFSHLGISYAVFCLKKKNTIMRIRLNKGTMNSVHPNNSA